MTRRADNFDIAMMFCGVSKVMVVFVTALTRLVPMAAINAWQIIRSRPIASPNLYIDPLPCLFLVAIARSIRSWAGLAREGIYSERH